MRGSMAKTMGELSKHHVKKSARHQLRTQSRMQVYTSSTALGTTQWQDFYKKRETTKDVHDYSSNVYQQEQDYYDTFSFESTLDRVLEMTQLGKEPSHDWENVVRASFKTDYLSEEITCHLCGKEMGKVDFPCVQCGSDSRRLT